jgi:hypothetical protein
MLEARPGFRAPFAPAIAFLALAACGGPSEGADAPADRADPAATGQEAMNTLTPEERAEGWRLLFDGRTTDGWRGFRQDEVPDGWQAVDGTLARVGPGGDLITVDQFGDFELTMEWKVEEAGNSGLFFRATEDVSMIYFGAPEVQILDDAGHQDGLSQLTAAGSNYALHPAPEGVVRPAGEWNEFRLVVDGARVEQWMNGVHVVTYELWSPEWEALVAESKFAEWPEYGRATRGHIGVQDHGDPVWFRNLKIRELR